MSAVSGHSSGLPRGCRLGGYLRVCGATLIPEGHPDRPARSPDAKRPQGRGRRCDSHGASPRCGRCPALAPAVHGPGGGTKSEHLAEYPCTLTPLLLP